MFGGKLARSVGLTLFALAVAARAGMAQTAPCPRGTPYASFAAIGGVPTNGSLGSPDQARIDVGTCVTLRLVIVRQTSTGTTTQDVTTDPNTLFFTSPPCGNFSGPNGSTFCPTTADCNVEFPIYADYLDPCTMTHLRDTLHVHVNPCPPSTVLTITGCPTNAAVSNQTVCSGTFPSGVTIPVASGGSGPITTTFNVTGATTATGLTLAQLQALTFNVGTSTITEVATDGTSTVSCTFLQIVVTRPTLSVTCPSTQNLATCAPNLPSNLSFTVSGACGTVTLSFSVSGVTTASNLTLAQLLALTFNAGKSTVTVNASTTTGQMASCMFDVNVNAPSLSVTCPGTQNLTGGGTNCTANLGSLTFTVNGQCGTLNPLSFTIGNQTLTAAQLQAFNFPVGTTTVTVNASTTTGQTASCMFDVKVSACNVIGCTFTQGYYKNHESVTCGLVGSGLIIGCHTYSCAEILNIFNTPVQGNGAIALAHQLIAARLNALSIQAQGGTVPSGAQTCITQANALLCNAQRLPGGFLSPSSTSALTDCLDAFNSGQSGIPHCD